MATCSVCFEPFAGSKVAPVECTSCHQEKCCQGCFENYLLHGVSLEPVCINTECKRPFTMDFIDAHTTSKFRKGAFRDQRAHALMDAQKAQLPATQQEAAHHRSWMIELSATTASLSVQRQQLEALPSWRLYQDLKATRRERASEAEGAAGPPAKRAKHAAAPTIADTSAARHAYSEAIAASETDPIGIALRKDIRRLAVRRVRLEYGYRAYGRRGPLRRDEDEDEDEDEDQDEDQDQEDEQDQDQQQQNQGVVALVRGPCPATNCRGFVGKDWACGLCGTDVCASCHDPKGSGSGSGSHVCDPDKVSTVTLLAKDTKACPRCAAPIFRVSGCSQMFCTQCHVAFDWGTRKLITEASVHNPHYFEWLATQKGSATAAAGGAAGGAEALSACALAQDGIPMAAAIDHLRTAGVSLATLRALSCLLCNFNQMRACLRQARTRAELSVTEYENNARVLRVRYLCGELDEAQWGSELQREEKARRVARAREQVLDMAVMAAATPLAEYLAAPAEDTAPLRDQLQHVQTFAEQQGRGVAARYLCAFNKDQLKLVGDSSIAERWFYNF